TRMLLRRAVAGRRFALRRKLENPRSAKLLRQKEPLGVRIAYDERFFQCFTVLPTLLPLRRVQFRARTACRQTGACTHFALDLHIRLSFLRRRFPGKGCSRQTYPLVALCPPFCHHKQDTNFPLRAIRCRLDSRMPCQSLLLSQFG